MNLLLLIIDAYVPSARIVGQRSLELVDMASEVLQVVGMLLEFPRLTVIDYSVKGDTTSADIAVHRLLAQLAYLLRYRSLDLF